MVKIVRHLLSGAVALAVAGAWLAAGDDEPVLAPAPVTTAMSSPAGVVVDGAASADPAPSALAAAAARLCADGCDEQPAPESAPDPVGSTEVVALPADLDAWSLAPEPLRLAAAAPSTAVRLFNTPPAPDEHDTTPADESDPYAPPAESPSQE